MNLPPVLFVCLGNICRSPLAEAAFRAAAERHGVVVETDSAGTGPWHVGQPPDRRAQRVAAAHGIDISASRARQVEVADFSRFAHIVAMDRSNLQALRRLQPTGTSANLSLLLDDVDGRRGDAVADPYYGDDADFDATWTDVTAGVEGLLMRMRRAR